MMLAELRAWIRVARLAFWLRAAEFATARLRAAQADIRWDMEDPALQRAVARHAARKDSLRMRYRGRA